MFMLNHGSLAHKLLTDWIIVQGEISHQNFNLKLMKPDVRVKSVLLERLMLDDLLPRWVKFTLRNIEYNTHRHEILLHIHHISTQTGSHSSCRNKSYRSSIQTVCRPKKFGTYCTRSRLHANAYLCNLSPVEIKTNCLSFQTARVSRCSPWNQFQ